MVLLCINAFAGDVELIKRTDQTENDPQKIKCKFLTPRLYATGGVGLNKI
jgi:hypothetical protein